MTGWASWGEVSWQKQPDRNTTLWLSNRMFLTPNVTDQYSHLFVWNDDATPSIDFDAEIYLQWSQVMAIAISQPIIRRGGHQCYEVKMLCNKRGTGFLPGGLTGWCWCRACA